MSCYLILYDLSDTFSFFGQKSEKCIFASSGFYIKKILIQVFTYSSKLWAISKKEMCVFEKLLLNKYITKNELQETSKQKHLYFLCIKNGS